MEYGGSVRMDNCAKNVIWYKMANGKVSSGQRLTARSRSLGWWHIGFCTVFGGGAMEALCVKDTSTAVDEGSFSAHKRLWN